jgi:transglutaminase-like putative cysteine protease
MPRRAKYRVLHETRYEYSTTVTSAHQLAHLEPRATPWQQVLFHRLEIDPAPGERADGKDYFGNGIVRFAVDASHDALTARAESVVEVESHSPNAGNQSVEWESALARPGVWGPDVDLEVEQYRVASPAAPVLQASRDYALSSFTPRRPCFTAMLDLARRIHAEFAYDPEATTVATKVDEVLELRRGVCQDYAHLTISCLRSLGLPARYVSGYVLNRPRPGETPVAGADASHAWASGYCPGLGWVDFDPTNGKLADLEFITLGWGREFSDVTPLRGVVLGAASQKLTVAVSVQPLQETAAPPADPSA